jgi:hypothetical protein
VAGAAVLRPVELAAQRTEPEEITFHGCPPEGDGGDDELYRLKNRVDEPTAYAPISVDSILTLPAPRKALGRRRSKWPAKARAIVKQYEGRPVTAEGYLVRVHESDPEPTNCHRRARDDRDWHIVLASAPGIGRAHGVVVEATPRVRARHPDWKLSALRRAARDDWRVRVSGFLMLDHEHPEDVGKSRGTLWEIHPITRIEVERNGIWTAIGSDRHE